MTLQDQVLAALQSHGLKSEGGNSYRSNSPFRAGSDSMSFSLTLDSDDGGAYYDHVSEEGGSLQALAAALGIAVDAAPQQQQSTKRAYKNMADYATAHGVDASVLVAAGWQQLTHRGRPALQFPTKTGPRVRYLDGEKPTFIHGKGYQRCWYGLNGTLIKRVWAERQPLILCNGEPSVVVGQHYGLAAACVTSGEKASIPDDLLTELRQWLDGADGVQIIVAMDCDAKGRASGIGIAEQLSAAGYDARAADLQLGASGDLADYCKLHGESAVKSIKGLPTLTSVVPPSAASLPVAVPQNAIIANGKTWLMMHAKDRGEIPPIEWIIPGEIPRRGLTVVYGTSGVGKSFYVIDRALSVSQTRPVIYAALEGESGVPSRIDAWCKHHSKAEGELILCLGEVNFFDEAEVDAFILGSRQVKPEMVVIDTLARAMGDGDENSTRDMNKLMSLCKRLYTQLECAVILVHHTGKDGQRERGSYALRGASDSMIALVDDDEFIQVECSKTKDAKPFQTYFMTLKPVDVGLTDAYGDALQTPVIVKAHRDMSEPLVDLTIRQRKVLEVMSQSIFEHGATPGEVMKVINGVPERSVYRIMSRLKESGLIIQRGARQPYRLSEEGREMMGLPQSQEPGQGQEGGVPTLLSDREMDSTLDPRRFTG